MKHPTKAVYRKLAKLIEAEQMFAQEQHSALVALETARATTDPLADRCKRLESRRGNAKCILECAMRRAFPAGSWPTDDEILRRAK